MGFKAGRMSEDIRRIISAEIRRLKDPRIGGGESLTVVRCDVARDGSFAKVYISSLDGMDSAKEAVKGLDSARGLIKREISNVLRLRKCPELQFIADDSSERGIHISRLLDSISCGESEEETDGGED